MAAPGGRHVAPGHAGRPTTVPVALVLVAILAAAALVLGLVILPRSGPRAPIGGLAEATDAAAASASEEPDWPAASSVRMAHHERVHGDVAPKSVIANGHGLLIANNMMYRHSSTLYDAASLDLVATVSDDVDLADFGFGPERAGITQGAPVEAAWTADGRYAYVSQYGLTGPGSGEASSDACTGGEAIGDSAVYRLDTETMAWDQVIEVGRVPKFITLSDDGTLAIVSNWCDREVSVIDLAAAEEIATIPVDSAPRGSVILPDNRTAYVTAMYADELFRLDLVTGESELVRNTGRKPRHLVLSPDRTRMYMTEAGADRLVVMDAATGDIVDEAPTGREPRSMAISDDGTALYVVNYYGNSVSKFDADTLEELQRESVGENPVGVDFEPTTRRVWVANYAGSFDVFDDTAEPEAGDADAGGDGPDGDGSDGDPAGADSSDADADADAEADADDGA